ncbi:MAG: glycosyltransferase [Candidatus Methanofastidiosia archaeon]
MITKLLMIFSFILIFFYTNYLIFGLLWGKRDKIKVKKGTYFPKVSVVTAVYNERENIERKMKNMVELDYPREMIEWIIVDSSEDETRRLIRDSIAFFPLKMILIEEEERRGLASALNMGYEASSSEIVIKSDCDTLLEKDSVKNLVSYFADSRVGGVTGEMVITNEVNVELGYRTFFNLLRLAESNLDSTHIFNQLSAYRRNLMIRIDEKSVADDSEIALAIRKKGYKTLYNPDAIFYERTPKRFRERRIQKDRRAQGQIQVILKNLDMLFNPRYGFFGIYVFPANFFMLIISPWMIFTALLMGILQLYESLGLHAIWVLILGAFFTYLSYRLSSLRFISGFLDSQLSLLIGGLKLLRSPEYIWKRPEI